MPELRKLAKQYRKESESRLFLEQLPHKYYDENMLHAVLIAQIRDYDSCMQELERFLPFVDNWAVCDCMSPAVFSKHRPELLEKISKWIRSEQEYTCRFGIRMLMNHFLEEDFQEGYLELPAQVRSEAYYVKMMVAWYFATALAKQWEAAVPYIEEHRLTPWIHRKTIQKACESYRITPEQKAYLKTFRTTK